MQTLWQEFRNWNRVGSSTVKVQTWNDKEAIPADTKSSKDPDSETNNDMEMGAFLIEKHKKKVNDEIRQRKQEKKLRDQLSSREVSSTPLSDNNMSEISVGPLAKIVIGRKVQKYRITDS